ncbi:11387_t:CDS:2 [Ambispora gerdemannii]|uniref:11387_t:CDS:1 n=1 Tax=Ambispora gerdemannii TaxID=144530 RepID=A0A9N8VY81_9GLOM|nr:11387_t:CDS:2 [Ambispora gerdemannii]
MSEVPKPTALVNTTPRLPRVEIEFCTKCRWLLRAGWMAQELLVTFSNTLGEVALVPGTDAVFRVVLDGELVWDRKEQGGFPELKELKQRVRDRVAPGMDLGHSDVKKTEGNTACETCDK